MDQSNGSRRLEGEEVSGPVGKQPGGAHFSTVFPLLSLSNKHFTHLHISDGRVAARPWGKDRVPARLGLGG